jgi:hypothetical protein
MKRDGWKQDGLEGARGAREKDVQQRPGPGKATRTSKLPESREATVQRKSAAANASAAPQARSAAEWTDDPQIDAAHRGLTALSARDQAAVQARGDVDAEDPAAVHGAAAAGVSGTGSALPYFDRIQAAFGGGHDLSGVRAHVGGDAGVASEQIGAQAYATGNHIAFRSQPDLHTAAHEAAHVVQQRAGVQLKGGVGAAGDTYERQADAVADSVVRGESAGSLLDGTTGAASRQAVQKQELPPQGQQPAQQPAGQQAGPAQQPVDVNALIAALQLPAPTLGTTANTLDIANALTWIENVQQRLRAAIQGHDALPADHADRARLARCITSATQQASGHMTTLATSIKTQLQTLMQNSSPVEGTAADGDTPAQAPATPTLPGVPDVDRLRVAAAGLSRDAHGTSTALVDTDRQMLAGAAGGMADAALAIYQSHGVLGARADWVTGFRQSTVPAADAATQAEADKALRGKQGAKDGLNAVFADSGFNRYGAQAIMTRSGWQPHDWCGMFVVRHLFRSAGLDAELRAGFMEVGNVKDFFNYTQLANASRIPVTVWVPEESRWMDLREFHRLRGSERTWTPRATIQAEIESGGAPFRSGDTLLINHSGGDVAQHIVMVDSYDATTGALRTIEGNTLGIRSNGEGLASRNREGELAADSGETSVGIHVREMRGDLGDREGRGAYQNKAGNTVLGCGRLSAADFENHRYSTMPIGSFPAAALQVSPEDMKAAAQKTNKVMKAQERGPAGRQ